MNKPDLRTNDLLIFTTLLSEAGKWLHTLQVKGLQHEAKWAFNNALKSMQAYERIIRKKAGQDVLEVQEDVSESFSNLLINLSKMDLKQQNKFAKHISKFFKNENDLLTK